MTAVDSEQSLDNPVWAALTGPHASFAEIHGQAARYRTDVSPFVALADESDPAAWADLATLAGPGGTIMLAGAVRPVPAGWQELSRLPGVQLVGAAVTGAEEPEAEPLGPADAPAMLDLVARTEPGPFLPRTVEMGDYLGIRRGGKLIAMAGERMHPPGWTEISAVCTDPAHRGQGLAGRLVRALAASIQDRGETPFLHAAATNVSAIRLYEKLGFVLRREPVFLAARAPA